MILTPTKVSLGKVRGTVELATSTGKPFNITTDAEEARWFIDHLDEPLEVVFYGKGGKKSGDIK